MGRSPSLQTQVVLAALLAQPSVWRYGLELSAETGLRSGTLYPILARLEGDLRWVESEWEDIDPVTEGRPARRYYRLTSDGAAAAAHELEVTRARLQPTTPPRYRTRVVAT